MWKFVAVVIVVGLIMYVLISQLKNKTYTKLVTLLQSGEIESFYKEIDSPKVKLLFPKIAILDLRLNAAILNQNKKECERLIEQICSQPLLPLQKEIYYMKAFNYYVSVEDQKMTKKYLDLVNTLNNGKAKQEANRIYNIYILKNDKDLKELLEELETMKDEQKGAHEYLISLIYHNRNDSENEKKYRELASTHFALIDAKSREKYQHQS